MSPERRNLLIVLIGVAALIVIVLLLRPPTPAGAPGPTSRPTPAVSRPAVSPGTNDSGGPSGSTGTPAGAATLVGAGDIASCGLEGDSQTANLVETIDGTVFVAGDDAYEKGTREEFARCYEPTWGRFKDRTIPVPGNHDYETRGAAGYLEYFGDAARPDGTTWYSREVGAWHVIVLDSNCGAIGGCDALSPQAAWLREDLGGNHAPCTLAIWHHPRFSSGDHGNDDRFDAFWRTLFDADADVVINGHDHDYERFAPQDPDSLPDDARGIREFVVGTGGAALRRFDTVVANSEARESDTHGVLKLTLREDRYDWEFIPVAGESFTDTGSDTCH